MNPYLRLAFAYLILGAVIMACVAFFATFTYIPMRANYDRCGSIFLCVDKR